MAQWLAIEWDAREARLALARGRGKELIVEHAFAVHLAGPAAGTPNEASIGATIGRALQQIGVSRVEALVAVGRANIELRQLSLPPAPAEELPELVRFQAMRQFTTIGEDWPLDYVQLAATEADSISILAAAMSPEVVQQIRRHCEGANLAPRRLVLRPFGAASLLRRHDQGTRQPSRLMVDLLAEEADLTVLDNEQVLLTRTVRLSVSEDNEWQARSLLGEIRRTIAAANNQLGGRRVEKVVLCGDGTDQTALKTSVETELSLPVELFDPFAGVTLGPALRERRPEHAGRFAPLLGMLFDEANSTPHLIDFLHPRKKPEPVNTRRRNSLMAATLATAVLAAVAWVWFELAALDDEIADLRQEAAALKSELPLAEKSRKDAATVQEFVHHNVNWLDEMVLLAQRLPPADQVLLTNLHFSAVPPQGGQVRLEGFMQEATQFQEIEENLRAPGRVVTSGAKPNDPKREQYNYGFAEIVRILPESLAADRAPPTSNPVTPLPGPEKPDPEKSGTVADKRSASGGQVK